MGMERSAAMNEADLLHFGTVVVADVNYTRCSQSLGNSFPWDFLECAGVVERRSGGELYLNVPWPM